MKIRPQSGDGQIGSRIQVYANELPGLGVDIDEVQAAKYACDSGVTTWTQTRLIDGTLQTP